MKIECLILRPTGTKVELDAPKRTYHFQPTSDDPRHIAEVGEASHAAMLLRIREAYRALDGESVQVPGEDDTNLPTRVLTGSQVHDARYTIHGGDEIELDDLVSMAFDDSGLTEAEWNELPDQERYEFIDATLTELRGGEREEENPPAPVNVNLQANAEDHTPPQVPTSDNDSTATTATGAEGQAAPTAPAAPAAPTVPDNAEPTAEELAQLPEEELRDRFKARFGRFPSKHMKPENIVAALAEDDD